jgi:hypothetical protein
MLTSIIKVLIKDTKKTIFILKRTYFILKKNNCINFNAILLWKMLVGTTTNPTKIDEVL